MIILKQHKGPIGFIFFSERWIFWHSKTDFSFLSNLCLVIFFFLQHVLVKIAILESIFMDEHGYPSDILTLNITQVSLLLEKPNITSGHLCPKEINVFKNSPKIIFM